MNLGLANRLLGRSGLDYLQRQPLLISGGFFGGAPRTAGASTTPLIKLIPLGAIVLGLSTVGVGVSLLI